jgi:hypothetical protein
MSKNLALTLLDRGNNGDEILAILESILDEFNTESESEEIEF